MYIITNGYAHAKPTIRDKLAFPMDWEDEGIYFPPFQAVFLQKLGF